MAKQWQIRRGTTAQNEEFIGALAEVTYDTEKKTVRVHDGVTAGGNPVITVETLKLIYPVGAIYIGTTTTCPLASFFGTWTLVSSGKALWTGDGTNADTTIEAGLPSIEHTHSGTINTANGWDGHNLAAGSNVIGTSPQTFSTGTNSAISNIYGNSDTVQPPAYVVNVWRRTA